MLVDLGLLDRDILAITHTIRDYRAAREIVNKAMGSGGGAG
jgi:hypothetical protein